MISTPALSDQQVKDFHEDGYLVVRGAFNAHEIGEIAAWTEELAGRPEKSGTHWVYHEKSLLDPSRELICRIENIVPFHEGLARLTETLAAPVGQLLGEKAVLFKEKINFKQSGGGEFKAHQDAQAGWNVYAQYYITALVSIDASTVENGCLELVAGRHKEGLVGDEWTPLGEGSTADMIWVPCPTQPGDLVFFDSYCPHRSGPNLTGSQRRVLYWTYNRASEGDHRAQYYADKHKNFPPDIERDPEREYVFRV